jgi:hypothetical protein
LFFVWSAHIVFDVRHSFQLSNERFFPRPVKPLKFLCLRCCAESSTIF